MEVHNHERPHSEYSCGGGHGLGAYCLCLTMFPFHPALPKAFQEPSLRNAPVRYVAINS